eukprot:Pgem_evm1s12371
MGTEYIHIPHSLIKELKQQNNLTISPNGIMFVKKKVRTGVLPLMLSEILRTRIMVKKSMGYYKKEHKNIYKTLDSRQF